MSQPWSRFLAATTAQISHSQHSFSRYAVRSFSQTCKRRADSDIDKTQSPSNPVRTTPEATPGEMERGAATSAAGPATTTRSIIDDLDEPSSSSSSSPSPSSPPSVGGGLRDLGAALRSSSSTRYSASSAQIGLGGVNHARSQPVLSELLNLPGGNKQGQGQTNSSDEPYHFHVYSHKHNTHITVTKPDRNAIISISAGQIGFRKSKRGSYDAGYQLAAYVIDKLHQGNWHNEIRSMEVALRGYGHGREACTKVLLGTEGRLLRGSIVKVSDATRLKFGGTRSPKPRRLG
ncbi:mitochondrial 37S ribosomal protein uS11m [Apiospora kogelbergensis]|uniref:Mitochondrial ribosomal protein subunit S18 n=1 Tax=Apiospora kogelbergensis TaxID=1337665 RepID=A0AAW0QJS4_9PEZI